MDGRKSSSSCSTEEEDVRHEDDPEEDEEDPDVFDKDDLSREDEDASSGENDDVDACPSESSSSASLLRNTRRQVDRSSPNDQPIVDERDSVPDVQILEEDKQTVRNHPLFPVMALLLEKCESATCSLDLNQDNSFASELEDFVRKQQMDGKSLLTNDPEVDTLMIKAIQVLRIHLLEMEKVQDLCKDFCQRYITCLKTKMSSENLLRGVTGFGSAGGGSFDDSASSTASSDENSCGPPPSHLPLSDQQQTLYRMIQSSQGLAAQGLPGSSGHQRIMMPPDGPRVDSGNEGDLSDDASSNSHSKKSQQKRGILPKQATSIMRSWLFQHIVHPYPTEDEKRTIAAQTNLTLLQVNNWFINARRRILQPMLDSANTLNTENQNHANGGSKSGGSPSKKQKVTTPAGNKTNPSLQRFWPESVSTASSQQGSGGRSSND